MNNEKIILISHRPRYLRYISRTESVCTTCTTFLGLGNDLPNMAANFFLSGTAVYGKEERRGEILRRSKAIIGGVTMQIHGGPR